MDMRAQFWLTPPLGSFAWNIGPGQPGSFLFATTCPVSTHIHTPSTSESLTPSQMYDKLSENQMKIFWKSLFSLFSSDLYIRITFSWSAFSVNQMYRHYIDSYILEIVIFIIFDQPLYQKKLLLARRFIFWNLGEKIY